jgi:hypothetical protein
LKKVLLTLILFLFLINVQLHTQEESLNNSRPSITIPKITKAPKVDAVLDDECWSIAKKISDFYMYEPVDGDPVSEKTEAFIAYDSENLYVAFRCYDKEKNKIQAYLSRRDNIVDEDRVGVVLDTFNSQRFAYGFEVNALGVQMDFTYTEETSWDLGPDMIYNSDGKLSSEGYIIEIAIPFKSLRFPPGDFYTIGLNLYRLIERKNEWATWPKWTKSKNTMLDQFGQIANIEGIEYSRNIELLPSFTALQVGELNGEGEFESSSPDPDFGFGLKYGVTPNITVDFTYNPDFSQVEADVSQVDINQRYELYYDEKRPFFLEGADVFKTDIEAFYSRRILDPRYGAKITGKIGKVTFGFLSTLDEGPGREVNGGNNPHLGERALFNILRGKYDLLGNSYVGFLMSSRQFAESNNHIIGIDSSFNFKQKYRLSFQALGSYTTTQQGKKFNAPALKVDLSRESRHLTYSFTYRDLYPDFQADVGFIKRTDIREGAMKIGYRFIPNNRWLIDYTPSLEYSRIYDHSGIMVEKMNKGSIEIKFKRNTMLTLAFDNGMERWADMDFDKKIIFLSLESTPTKYVSSNIEFQTGESIFYDEYNPYLGNMKFFKGEISIKPNARIREELIFTKSTFWQEKGGKEVYDYNIIRSKTTYHFNKKLYLRTILEYNAYWEELSTDMLLSYMHNYGTVFFLGYGGLFDRDEYMHFRQNHRSLFVKVSYLWRI